VFLVGKVGSMFNTNMIIKISIIGTAIATFALILPQSTLQVFAIVPFWAMFSSFALTNITSEVSNSSPKNSQGEVLGINSGLQNLAQALPPIFSGFLSFIFLANQKTNITTLTQNFVDVLPIILATVCMILALYVVNYKRRVDL
jgi:MFS family permease